jgi:hypothetical protein
METLIIKIPPNFPLPKGGWFDRLTMTSVILSPFRGWKREIRRFSARQHGLEDCN